MDYVKPDSSAHWYSKEGIPQHTYINQKGGVSNTTLREARKFGLLPSVTSILNILDKPSLNAWKQEQVILSALTLPREDNESDHDFAKRVIIDSQEQSKQAGEKGSDIHTAIERYFLGEKVTEHLVIAIRIDGITGSRGWVFKHSEKVLVAQDYAGTADLIFTGENNKVILADVKTTTFKDGKPFIPDDWACQLAAYGIICEADFHVSIVIDRITKEIVVIEWDEEAIERGWRIFRAAKEIWKLQKNYWPEDV